VPNHNWWRITRSLTLLGLASEALALYDRLATAYHGRFPISAETFGFGTEADCGHAEE
jgi:hypothetical protein